MRVRTFMCAMLATQTTETRRHNGILFFDQQQIHFTFFVCPILEPMQHDPVWFKCIRARIWSVPIEAFSAANQNNNKKKSLEYFMSTCCVCVCVCLCCLLGFLFSNAPQLRKKMLVI